MAYIPDRTKPQHITVEATVNGQLIVNTFWYRHSQGVGPSDGSSFTLLNNFILAYRGLLAQFYDVYRVNTYWMREVIDAVFDPTPAPGRWVPVYNPLGVEQIFGAPGDVGLLASAGQQMLPAHEALRVRKRPLVPRIGFFRSGYNRFCPWAEIDVGNVWEQFTAGFIAALQGVCTTFNNTTIADGGAAPNTWTHSIHSSTLFGRVIKPAGGPIYNAGTFVFQYLAIPTIGTQTTRRFKPNGLKRGA